MSVSSPDLGCAGCACAFIGKPKIGAADESGRPLVWDGVSVRWGAHAGTTRVSRKCGDHEG